MKPHSPVLKARVSVDMRVRIALLRQEALRYLDQAEFLNRRFELEAARELIRLAKLKEREVKALNCEING